MTDTVLKNTKLIVKSLAIVACNGRLQLQHEYRFLTPCLTIFLLFSFYVLSIFRMKNSKPMDNKEQNYDKSLNK